MGKYNPLRYRGYVYDEGTGLYYLQSRYYDPEMGRFLNADGYTSTGQGLLGNNMYSYCGNNPVVRSDAAGNMFVVDRGGEGKYRPYTFSFGLSGGAGIGPLSVSGQVALVFDSEGKTEIQLTYSAPNIFSSGLPSIDEMFMGIASGNSSFDFGLSLAGTFSYTNAPSVANLRGSGYSVGVSGAGLAVDYNVLPTTYGSAKAYSGVTVSGGIITPGVNIGMSDTVQIIELPISVYDVAETMEYVVNTRVWE